MAKEEIEQLRLDIIRAVEASGRIFIESRKKSGLPVLVSRNGVIVKIEAKDL